MSDTTETPLPAAWRAAHLVHQAMTLLAAGLVFLAATWGSPIYQALLVQLPVLVLPPGVPLSPRVFAPLLVPVVLGLPLVFGRQRALALLWVVVMALLVALAVVEVSRLNWVSFFSGIAFRIESGPVPLLRTLAGMAVLLCGLLLLAHQATLETVRHLAERGVPLRQLTEVRRRLLGLERGLLLALLGGGVVLTLVAAVSMSVTESAPETGTGWVTPLLWVTLLLAGLLVAFALGLWHRRGRRGEEATRP